jgi:hypothetical protein
MSYQNVWKYYINDVGVKRVPDWPINVTWVLSSYEP